jgi:dipeptidyl aminopeptidase/acylaminoacyl peptidase
MSTAGAARFCLSGLALLLIASAAKAEQALVFTVDDLLRVEDLSEPVFAPDSERIVYVVEGLGEGDSRQSDLWTVRWEGGDPQALTATPGHSEWSPRFSADGSFLAYLSDAAEDETTQLWVRRDSEEPRQASHLPGGVSDYTLSPDGASAIVVAEVGAHIGSSEDPAPPIVVTRFLFKEDGRDWIDDRRQQLFRIDLASGEAVQITSGDHDNAFPRWSPDGRWIAFVSRRCADPDRHYCSDVYVMPAQIGEPRRISPSENGDADPDFEAGGPRWSSDSRRLVWVEAGEERLTWYTPLQLVTADIETGAVARPGRIDRWFYYPQWSADGSHILSLVEQDRDTWLASIDPASGTIDYLTSGLRFAYDFAVAPNGRIAVLDGGSDAPTELRTIEAESRVLSPQNAWVTSRALGETRDVSFMSGDVEVHGMIVLPPGHEEGQRHPLIVRLHGGPVYQFSHEFMADWQTYAAQGYVVVAANPRGGSGRGFDFARAIYADWGNKDVQDVLAAVDHVVKLGIADPARLGVGGHSYGGMLTNYVIASDTRFRAAVSGAGASNILGMYGHDQYSNYYELELGTPWLNRDVYERVSFPFLHADRIKTPTLFYCAGADDNVPCLGSEQMYQALRTQDIPSQLVIYPDEYHALTIPSYLRDRLRRHLEWYDRFLKPAVDADRAAP